MLSVSAAHVAPWDDPRCSGCLMRCDFGGVEVRLCGDDSEANEESDNKAVMSSTSFPPVLTCTVITPPSEEQNCQFVFEGESQRRTLVIG